MPIKLNGTVIIDETNLANKDLSNISSAGANVIKSYIQQEVSNTMTPPNFAAAVILSAQQQYDGYTPSVDGYLFLRSVPGATTTDTIATCTIAGKTVFQKTKSSSYVYEDNFCMPVPAGQQIKTNVSATGFGPTYTSRFAQVMFVPKI